MLLFGVFVALKRTVEPVKWQYFETEKALAQSFSVCLISGLDHDSNASWRNHDVMTFGGKRSRLIIFQFTLSLIEIDYGIDSPEPDVTQNRIDVMVSQ